MAWRDSVQIHELGWRLAFFGQWWVLPWALDKWFLEWHFMLNKNAIRLSKEGYSLVLRCSWTRLKHFILIIIVKIKDRQLCGPQNIDEMECADGFGCCWDPEIDQCFRPESTFQCLEMGGSCKSKDNIDCNRGIGPGVDICPQVQSKIIKKLKSFRINDAAWTATQINARRRKNSGKLMTENVF